MATLLVRHTRLSLPKRENMEHKTLEELKAENAAEEEKSEGHPQDPVDETEDDVVEDDPEKSDDDAEASDEEAGGKRN